MRLGDCVDVDVPDDVPMELSDCVLLGVDTGLPLDVWLPDTVWLTVTPCETVAVLLEDGLCVRDGEVT